MFGCDSDMSIGFLVLLCNFIINEVKVLWHRVTSLREHSVSFSFIFNTEAFSFFLDQRHRDLTKMSLSGSRPCQGCSLTVWMVSVSGKK